MVIEISIEIITKKFVFLLMCLPVNVASIVLNHSTMRKIYHVYAINTAPKIIIYSSTAVSFAFFKKSFQRSLITSMVNSPLWCYTFHIYFCKISTGNSANEKFFVNQTYQNQALFCKKGMRTIIVSGYFKRLHNFRISFAGSGQ